MAEEKKEPINKENPNTENVNQPEAAAAEVNDDTVMFNEKKRWIFLGLPFSLTRYIITPALVTVRQGLLNTTENDCYMYKVQDVKLSRSLFEKIVGVGTISCFTGDVTTPQLVLRHVKHSPEIKSYLLKQSEAARIKRRTLSTQDISAHGGMDLDHDGIPDYLE